MTERRYTQAEHEDRDNDSVAVMRNDIKYIRGDLAEIKAEVRDFKRGFQTKEEAVNDRTNLGNRITNLEKDRDEDRERTQFYVRAFATAIITTTVGVLLLYFLGHKP